MTLAPVFRRKARLEYAAALRWYARQRKGLGAAFAIEVEHALERACAAPHRFPVMISDVRRVRVLRFPFAIYFRVRQSELRIIAVFHARRNPREWQER